MAAVIWTPVIVFPAAPVCFCRNWTRLVPLHSSSGLAPEVCTVTPRTFFTNTLLLLKTAKWFSADTFKHTVTQYLPPNSQNPWRGSCCFTLVLPDLRRIPKSAWILAFYYQHLFRIFSNICLLLNKVSLFKRKSVLQNISIHTKL